MKDLVLRLPFTKHQLRGDHKTLNGVCIYNTKNIYINLSSYDFQQTKIEDDIIDLFVGVDTHETVHLCIHEILEHGGSCDMEETIALLMSDQMDIETKNLTYGVFKRRKDATNSIGKS